VGGWVCGACLCPRYLRESALCGLLVHGRVVRKKAPSDRNTRAVDRRVRAVVIPQDVFQLGVPIRSTCGWRT